MAGTCETSTRSIEFHFKEVADVSEVKLIGGQRRQIRVTLDEARMAAYNVAPAMIVPLLQQANRQLQSGSFAAGNREFLVETGGFIHSAEEVGSVVIGVTGDKPVYLRDVSHIEDGAEEPADYVLYGTGPAFQNERAPRQIPAGLVHNKHTRKLSALTNRDWFADAFFDFGGFPHPSTILNSCRTLEHDLFTCVKARKDLNSFTKHPAGFN